MQITANKGIVCIAFFYSHRHPEPGDGSLQAALTRAAENLGSFPGQLDGMPIDNLKTSRQICKA